MTEWLAVWNRGTLFGTAGFGLEPRDWVWNRGTRFGTAGLPRDWVWIRGTWFGSGGLGLEPRDLVRHRGCVAARGPPPV
eukprot:scaffold1909_cov56-Isochrysis_galbana.AAC.1